MDINCSDSKMMELSEAERLLAAEKARLGGIRGYTLDEFYLNMVKAIKSVDRSEQHPDL